MNKYYQKFREQASLGSRDPVFIQVLYNWLNKLDSINILNIGSERDLAVESRAGDGWANFYWAEFVQYKGGKLTIVDNDTKAIFACQLMLGDFVGKIDINFITDSGLNHFNQPYNFVYLDGPDDNNFTLECMQKIDKEKCSVLIDDANNGGKADLVKATYPNYWLFPCNYIHELIFYPSTELKKKVLNY